MDTGAVLLRRSRRLAGLSQVELGRRAGVPQSVISAYERGRREPSLASLQHLLAAAGFTLEVVSVDVPSAPPFTGPVGRRLQRRRAAARRLLADRGYRDVAVFGSVARQVDTADSDVDLLAEPPDGVGLIELGRAAIDLEALLGVPVDLVPRAGLRDRIRKGVLAEAVPL